MSCVCSWWHWYFTDVRYQVGHSGSKLITVDEVGANPISCEARWSLFSKMIKYWSDCVRSSWGRFIINVCWGLFRMSRRMVADQSGPGHLVALALAGSLASRSVFYRPDTKLIKNLSSKMAISLMMPRVHQCLIVPTMTNKSLLQK